MSIYPVQHGAVSIQYGAVSLYSTVRKLSIAQSACLVEALNWFAGFSCGAVGATVEPTDNLVIPTNSD